MHKGFCDKNRDLLPASYYALRFYLQIGYFREWACLDSNQGPLPYQRNSGLSVPFCSIRVCRLDKPFLAYLAHTLFGSVRPRPGRVAAQLLHKFRDKTTDERRRFPGQTPDDL
jgi:hypothetical protein